MKVLLITFSVFLGSILSVKGQHKLPPIVFNHCLVIVDSTSYAEILKSEFLKSTFAFLNEKKLDGYSGIYIIGQDNYIEIFNPKSIQNEIHEPGESWICHTSMKVNQLESLKTNNKMFSYSTNEAFDELSLYFKDSTNLFTTWEMNKSHYENWSKKVFSDSVNFLSVDYNSPAESEASHNFLFNNVAGVSVSINASDSLAMLEYLNLIGYSKTKANKHKLRFSNSIDFIEIEFHKELVLPRITSIYLNLNKKSKFQRIQFGNSELTIKRKQAVWKLDRYNFI